MSLARHRNSLSCLALGQADPGFFDRLKQIYEMKGADNKYTTYASPPPPGPTGVAEVDRGLQNPVAKIALIGLIAAGAARSFPGKFWLPFFASSMAAVMVGIVPDVKTS